MKKTTENGKRIVTVLMTTFLMCLCWGSVACATNYGQNAANVIFDNLFWVALIVIAFVVIRLFMSSNTVGMIITIIVGGVICFLLKNPTVIGDVGNNIGNVIFK